MAIAVIATLALAAPSPTAQPLPPTPTPIEIHLNPLVDMHFWVRSLVAAKGELPVLPGLPEAVEAARSLDTELDGVWIEVEESLARSANAEEFARRAAGFSTHVTRPVSIKVHLREGSVRLAAAYRTLETPFLETVWPRHRAAVEAATAALRRDLLPRAPAVLADLQERLALSAPSLPIPVYLVAEGPSPAARTYMPLTGPMIFATAGWAMEAQNQESFVFHVLLAISPATERSVLTDLRHRLRRRSPPALLHEISDFAHVLTWAQAAGTTRRVFDPAHRDDGDVKGEYQKTPRAAGVVVPAWRAYLSSEITREAALTRIVDGFAAEPKPAGKASGPQAAAAPAAPPASASPALIDLRFNPFLDMHAWVRRLVEKKTALPAIPSLSEAAESVRALDADLGGGLAWGMVDGTVAQAANAESFAKVAADLPETKELFGGKTVHLRAGAVRLAAAYRALEKPFLETVWPRHREAVEAAAAALRHDLLPRAPAVYEDLQKNLGLRVPSRPIPVYLVAEEPFPGAVTYPVPGGAVCIVAADAAAGTQKLEAVIHETIHALDVVTEGSVLDDLRRRLETLDPPASPREEHDFVHTLMFVQAAGTVRRVIDPAHQDYGDVNGYYPKVPRAAAVVVPAWRAYLNGEISREAALDRIVDGFAKGAGNEKGGPKAAPQKPPGGG